MWCYEREAISLRAMQHTTVRGAAAVAWRRCCLPADHSYCSRAHQLAHWPVHKPHCKKPGAATTTPTAAKPESKPSPATTAKAAEADKDHNDADDDDDDDDDDELDDEDVIEEEQVPIASASAAPISVCGIHTAVDLSRYVHALNVRARSRARYLSGRCVTDPPRRTWPAATASTSRSRMTCNSMTYATPGSDLQEPWCADGGGAWRRWASWRSAGGGRAQPSGGAATAYAWLLAAPTSAS